jgi:hypothetical protein
VINPCHEFLVIGSVVDTGGKFIDSDDTSDKFIDGDNNAGD